MLEVLLVILKIILFRKIAINETLIFTYKHLEHLLIILNL